MPMNSDIFSLLQKLVSMQSEYPHEQKMGEYVFSFLKNAGFKTEKQYIDSERFNVLAEKGTGKKKRIAVCTS